MSHWYFTSRGPALSAQKLREAKPKLIILDFDGTLTPIKKTPELVHLSKNMKSVLAKLAHCADTIVVILSGRSLNDLQRRVGIVGIVYFGNHGLTSNLADIGFKKTQDKEWITIAKKARRVLNPLAKQFPGSFVEFKGIDLSLHYRLVPVGKVPELIAEAQYAVRRLRLTITQGKKVLEFRPRSHRNKGWAIRYIARNFAGGWKRTGICLYLGDDHTDEDAFAALLSMGPRALGMKVGMERTLAPYRLKNIREVQMLLKSLITPNVSKREMKRIKQQEDTI